jgi:hypothetical protein
MRRRRLIAPCAGLALWSVAHSVSAWSAPASSECTVASVTGDWRRSGKTIRFGDTLPEGACVTGSAGALVVWWRGQLVSHTCKRPAASGECGVPSETGCVVKLTASVSAHDPRQTRFAAIVAPLIHEHPLRYLVAASRGIGQRLTEAVVPLTPPQLDLAPALAALPYGVYRVRLTSLSASPSIATRALAITWTPGTSAFVSGANIAAGLYRLSLVDENGESGDDAWVLVSPVDRYETQSTAFREAVELAGQWPKETTPEATRAALRAYLESLSHSTGAVREP